MRPGDVTKTSKWLQKRDGPNSKKPLNLFGTEATQQSLLNQYTDTNTEMDNTIILCKAVLLIFFQTSVISLLWLASVTTGQFTDCLQANRTCHQDQKCHLLLTVLPRQCGDGVDRRGEACSPLQIQYCSQSLRDILQFNHFQTCQCPHNMPNYEECEAFRESVFLHKCAQITQDGGSHLVQARAVAVSYNKLETEDSLSPSGGNDCFEMRKICQKQRRCGRHLTAFRQHCKVRGGRCYADSREKCIEAYEALRPSGIFLCTCDSELRRHSYRKCTGILHRFVKNACLMVANQAAILGKEDSKLPSKPKVETAEPDNKKSNIDDVTIDNANTEIDDTVLTNSIDGRELTEKDYETWIDDPGPDDRLTPPSVVPLNDVTCYTAFASCNADNDCRIKIGKFLTSCQWDLVKNNCDRQACLPAMNSFFQTVDMKYAHAAAFCTCEPDDRQCHSLKSVLQPKCAQMETPTPSCLSIHKECVTDETCRKRLDYYTTYCEEDKRVGGCTNSPSMCRDAIVGLMGTLLLTNCTCSEYDLAISRCSAMKNGLHHNSCRARAGNIDVPLVNQLPTTTDKLSKDETEDKQVVKISVSMTSITKERRACSKRRLDVRHKLMRIYPDQTECSQLCHCLINGTLTCTNIPCPSTESCILEGSTHTHGTMFHIPHRAQCQCRSTETICAKPLAQPSDDGIYLFVGYSMNDMLALANHSVKISFSALSQKLTELLNGERFVDTCTVSKYINTPGNIVFRIDTLRTTQESRRAYSSNSWNTEHSIIDQTQPGSTEKCFFKAKLLEIMINGRQNAIASDPELSIIRIATVETIRNKFSSQRSGAISNQPHSPWFFSTLHVIWIAIGQAYRQSC